MFFDKKVLNKVAKLSFPVFFIWLFVVGCSSTSHQKSHPKEVRQGSVKRVKQKEKANKVLKKRLGDDRQLVQSNSSDPDSGSNYTKYVDDIKYVGRTNITVNVNNNFMSLDEQQRTSVINSTQAMAKSTLWKNNIIGKDDVLHNLFTTIRLGSDQVGRSKMNDVLTYEWEK